MPGMPTPAMLKGQVKRILKRLTPPFVGRYVKAVHHFGAVLPVHGQSLEEQGGASRT